MTKNQEIKQNKALSKPLKKALLKEQKNTLSKIDLQLIEQIAERIHGDSLQMSEIASITPKEADYQEVTKTIMYRMRLYSGEESINIISESGRQLQVAVPSHLSRQLCYNVHGGRTLKRTFDIGNILEEEEEEEEKTVDSAYFLCPEIQETRVLLGRHILAGTLVGGFNLPDALKIELKRSEKILEWHSRFNKCFDHLYIEALSFVFFIILLGIGEQKLAILLGQSVLPFITLKYLLFFMTRKMLKADIKASLLEKKQQEGKTAEELIEEIALDAKTRRAGAAEPMTNVLREYQA